MIKWAAYYFGQVLIVLGALVCVGPIVGGFAGPGDVGRGWSEVVLAVGLLTLVLGAALFVFGTRSN